MASRARRTKELTLWLLTLGALGLGAATAAEQQPWEYAPYRIQVWVALPPAAEFTDGLYARLAETIVQQADIVAGAAWDVRVARCPPAVAALAAGRIEAVTVEDVKTAEPALLKEQDKLFLLCVRVAAGGWSLAVRELDCRTRAWRPAVSRRLAQLELLPGAAFSLIADAFSAIVRIDNVKGHEAEVRVRAGGLLLHPDSPAAVRDTDVLLPILRMDDRFGEPMKNGIQVAPWTVLSVTGRTGNVLQCRIHSGMATLLGGRSSSRIVKLALVAKPRFPATQLRVMTTGPAPAPLAGYEIYAKDPERDKTEFVGATDWRGMVTVPRTDRPIRVLYVRSGGRLLARCPLVPGLEPELTVQVPNDDLRLQAEGFVKGLQTRLMDIMARRELYAARFHRHLEKKELDKAKAMLDEFRRLETRAELSRLLDQQQQRITSPDRATQARIDKLFTESRRMLLKFLDPNTVNQLASELDQASGGKS